MHDFGVPNAGVEVANGDACIDIDISDSKGASEVGGIFVGDAVVEFVVPLPEDNVVDVKFICRPCDSGSHVALVEVRCALDCSRS